MPTHQVELDDSFVEYFGVLDQVAQAQIRSIWAGLEQDAYYLPSDAEYSISERRGDYRACQHISGWQGWVLAWFWEYYSTLPTTPECVVLTLAHHSPPTKLEPKLWH